MTGFNIVDGIVLAVVAVSAILAYSRGFVRELLSIVGWVAAAMVAFVFAPAAEPLVREIPVVSDLLGTNCELGLMAGFAVVFAVALILFSIFTPLISGAIQNSALSPVDQGLGLLFGVFRALVLVVIAFVIYDRLVGESNAVEQVENSRSRALLAGMEERLFAVLPDDAPQWVAGKYESLTQRCE